MNEAQAKKLIENLLATINDSRSKWRRNATQDGFFLEVSLTNGDSSVIELRKRRSTSATLDQESLVLEITDANGKMIDSIMEDLPNVLGFSGRNKTIGLSKLYSAIEGIGDPLIDRIIAATSPGLRPK